MLFSTILHTFIELLTNTCSSVIITIAFSGNFFLKHRAKNRSGWVKIFSHNMCYLLTLFISCLCVMITQYNTHFFPQTLHQSQVILVSKTSDAFTGSFNEYAIITPVSFVWTVTRFIHNNKQIQLYTEQPFQLERELNKIRYISKSIKCPFDVIKVKRQSTSREIKMRNCVVLRLITCWYEVLCK